MNKIIIISIWLIGTILVPAYVTFTNFGEIKFGEFYSGVTSICMILCTAICTALWVNDEEKLNEK